MKTFKISIFQRLFFLEIAKALLLHLISSRYFNNIHLKCASSLLFSAKHILWFIICKRCCLKEYKICLQSPHIWQCSHLFLSSFSRFQLHFIDDIQLVFYFPLLYKLEHDYLEDVSNHSPLNFDHPTLFKITRGYL